MLYSKLANALLVAFAAFVTCVAVSSAAFADDAQTQALKDQMRVMQQQMQQLQQQIDALSQAQAAQPAGPPGGAGPSVAKGKEVSTEPRFDKFLKGFYGDLDVSIDYTTKGMSDFVAYGNAPIVLANGQYGGFTINTSPKNGGAPPYGNVSWLPDRKSVV